MWYVLGILVGMGLPVQTCQNTRLKERLGTTNRAALVSFSVGSAFLILLVLATDSMQGLQVAPLRQEPLWIWTGGIVGLIFIAANITLMARLGSVETAILPAMGQILMGLAVDHYGWFRTEVIPMSLPRLAGGVLVAAGVLLVAVSDRSDPAGRRPDGSGWRSWLWRGVGIGIGCLVALQFAVNSQLGQILGRPLLAASVSFGVSTLLLALLVLAETAAGGRTVPGSRGGPWWMWPGGILGASYVAVNVYLSPRVGVGLTVLVLLGGVTAGGVLIDRYGLLGAERKPVTFCKVCGLVLALFGAAVIRVLGV